MQNLNAINVIYCIYSCCSVLILLIYYIEKKIAEIRPLKIKQNMAMSGSNYVDFQQNKYKNVNLFEKFTFEINPTLKKAVSSMFPTWKAWIVYKTFRQLQSVALSTGHDARGLLKLPINKQCRGSKPNALPIHFLSNFCLTSQHWGKDNRYN